MMDAIATLFRLGLAAGLSGAAAGWLLAWALLFGANIDEAHIGWSSAGLADLWFLAVFGITLGIPIGGVPSFFAGALLWGTGRHSRAARHVLAWAGAGAVVGALLWMLLELTFLTPGRGPHLTRTDIGFFIACLIAGAGGALTFRATMTCTAFMEE
jgi:hypothetical protein